MKIDIKLLIIHALGWRDFFIELVFPVECLGCGRPGEWLCLGCFHKLKLDPKQHCIACGKKKQLGRICRSCSEGWSLDGLWNAGYYDDELMKRLIKFYKYYFLKGLSSTLGKFMSMSVRDLINKNDFWQERPLAVLKDIKGCLIIPIPLHAKRERFRGFNQAQLLAVKLSEALGVGMDDRNLVRIRHTRAQAKLAKAERFNNIEGCFSWRGSSLGKRRIILVDDVATTGATLNEAARILKENGAGEVWGLVVARG